MPTLLAMPSYCAALTVNSWNACGTVMASSLPNVSLLPPGDSRVTSSSIPSHGFTDGATDQSEPATTCAPAVRLARRRDRIESLVDSRVPGGCPSELFASKRSLLLPLDEIIMRAPRRVPAIASCPTTAHPVLAHHAGDLYYSAASQWQNAQPRRERMARGTEGPLLSSNGGVEGWPARRPWLLLLELSRQFQ